ncbi:hypothetical protein EMGBS4_17180 [Acidimicrobiaceae bacterium]|nr:hypothetical protein EMGBS4_17180 [Acidimicrobiaceae bacterium]
MADSLGLEVVAEGVETVQQLHALADLDCSQAQGYLISHPVSPHDIPAALVELIKLVMAPSTKNKMTNKMTKELSLDSADFGCDRPASGSA